MKKKEIEKLKNEIYEKLECKEDKGCCAMYGEVVEDLAYRSDDREEFFRLVKNVVEYGSKNYCHFDTLEFFQRYTLEVLGCMGCFFVEEEMTAEELVDYFVYCAYDSVCRGIYWEFEDEY